MFSATFRARRHRRTDSTTPHAATSTASGGVPPTSARGARLGRGAILGAVAVAAIVLAGCASDESGDLYIAQAPADSASQSEGVMLYAVSPGDSLDSSRLIATGMTGIDDINSRDHAGNVWTNSVGRSWAGSNLVVQPVGSQTRLITSTPGEDPELIASPLTTTAMVGQRGVFATTPSGCVLATDSTTVTDVGQGLCAMSPDERFVMSWPNGEEGLSIRDLRAGETRRVEGLTVLGAAGVARDTTVAAVVTVDGGMQAVVLDATTGEERGRSEVYAQLQLGPTSKESEGFVARGIQQDANDMDLVSIDTDGNTEVITTSEYLEPLSNSPAVIYLALSAERDDGRIMRWQRGSDPTELLRGDVGATVVDQDHAIATVETADSVRIHRTNHGTGEMVEVLRLNNVAALPGTATPGGTGVAVRRALLKNGTAHLVVQTNLGMSYVRVDMTGSHSDVPIADASQLLLNSLDGDGTALLSRPSDDGVDLVTVRANTTDVDVRATVESVGPSLMRSGRVIFTDVSDAERPVVNAVAGSGKDREVETLWENALAIGASWPQDGGATETEFVTVRSVLERQTAASQQAQAAQQAAAAGQGG